jgi:hypothetical protein
LRKGTVWLFRTLRSRGHRISIYTSSFRSPWRLGAFFREYGVGVDYIINEMRHRRQLAKLDAKYRLCSKYPPMWGIDVLIDDSEAILLEGRRYGFAMIIVRPDDRHWLTTIARGLGPEILRG